MQQDDYVCKYPNTLPGENYAVMGGLLGGLACTALYILLMRTADMCYRRQYTHHAERPSVGDDWEIHHRPTAMTGMYTSSSTLPASPRHVRFDANFVERVENPSSAVEEEQQQQSQQERGGSVNSHNSGGGGGQHSLYSRGMTYEDVSSPPPSLPPKR
ncbi:uncharacterized protein TM35_000121690 [Trypanosoma theileri]|uniref:Uncharacterized protein n=1 Tax=Trypanosoma theileri TaxID=67003 RepID=A0A1X0NXH7_9TRYP|nr:uncharacterized protein TM35_000121690 [Trypanosoma theileri]ORC89394.1 hypothetical protein TM35_000121690 [Trypanosoma theileri]